MHQIDPRSRSVNYPKWSLPISCLTQICTRKFMSQPIVDWQVVWLIIRPIIKLHFFTFKKNKQEKEGHSNCGAASLARKGQKATSQLWLIGTLDPHAHSSFCQIVYRRDYSEQKAYFKDQFGILDILRNSLGSASSIH